MEILTTHVPTHTHTHTFVNSQTICVLESERDEHYENLGVGAIKTTTNYTHYISYFIVK